MQQLPINRGIISLVFLLPCFLMFPPVSCADTVRKIQYTFTLQNTHNKSFKNVHIRIHAPVKENSVQKCLSIKAAFPYHLATDDYGNQVLDFEFDEIAPFGTKIIKIEAVLSLTEKPRHIKSKLLKDYSLSSEYMQSDDPNIKQLAGELKGYVVLKTAENIFKWICANIKDQAYTQESRGALFALKNKKGDCTEQAYLFCALCRASNIPSRVSGGYICRADTVLKPAQFHNWAEFYIDGKWRIADPQRKKFMEHESDYIAMAVEESGGINLSAGTITETGSPSLHLVPITVTMDGK